MLCVGMLQDVDRLPRSPPMCSHVPWKRNPLSESVCEREREREGKGK